MSESGRSLIDCEARIARRLSRLFRIERNGGFERSPFAIVKKVVDRRGMLVEVLMTIDSKRRSVGALPSQELEAALTDLSREAERTWDRAHARLEQIGNDLRLSRGEGLATGIRTSTAGHNLGTS